MTEFGLMTKTKNSEGSQAVGLLNCCTDVSRRANIYIHNCYRNNIILLKNKARSFKSTKQNKILKFRIIDFFLKKLSFLFQVVLLYDLLVQQLILLTSMSNDQINSSLVLNTCGPEGRNDKTFKLVSKGKI